MAEAEINARSGAGGGPGGIRHLGLYAYPLTLGSRGADNNGVGSEPEGEANYMKYMLCGIRNSSIPGSMQYSYLNQSVALPIPPAGVSSSYGGGWASADAGTFAMGALAVGSTAGEFAENLAGGGLSSIMNRNAQTLGMLEEHLAREARAINEQFSPGEPQSNSALAAAGKKRSALMQRVIGSVTKSGAANSFNAGLANNVTGGIMSKMGGMIEPAQYTMGMRSVDQTMMSYGGPKFRDFNFNYHFMPQSPEEMSMIESIIKWFKFYSAPVKWSNEITRVYELPAVFKIKFYTGVTENKHMNKIGYCALNNISVKYGGNKFQTFVPDSGGAPPIETTLSLAFNELEIVVRDVQESKDTDPTIQSGY